jgi:hypothetical protein
MSVARGTVGRSYEHPDPERLASSTLTGGEDVGEELVGLLAVLVLCLTLEAVCTVHLLCLMVPTVEEHPMRI